ncbi:Heterochromatin protein 1 [Orchesella cincta]|uniref:Heterochromatin protein 1 n=1 Tax=Orchesella cincta TaxID=48709 RepID=A0A1D2MFJ4_ORCCI|nr:Heterochromatin protein 1 [Orchesella cincta]
MSTSSSKKAKTKESVPGRVIQPDGVEEFKVEKIVTKKLIDGVVHYRIKWVGWDSKDNTWEPIDHLENCIDMVNAFEAAYQGLSGSAGIRPILSPKKKRRGRPTKLRPTEKSGHEDDEELLDVNAQKETDVEQMQGDGITDEILDREFMGPMFRRVWRQSEVPLCILGSTNIHGALVHLVRIKTKDDNNDEAVLEDPYKGLDANNCVMVLAQTFNCHFPQMVLKYYETHTTIVDDVSTDEENAAKTARIEILRLCRTQGVCSNENQIFRDILQTTNSIISTDCTDSKEPGASSQAPTAISSQFSPTALNCNVEAPDKTTQFDQFGLPISYSGTDTDDSSDDETVAISDT